MLTADPQGTLTGTHKMDGNTACAEGALAAGCRFFAGYPMPPAQEIAERFAKRIPQLGGVYIQMEDEMSAMNAILGASWAGLKSFSATSGPGFSLMLENLGLGTMLETPTLIINVQRAGPALGIPDKPAQADVMQARWGSHGDYELIVLAPNSPQECFDLTVQAVNWSEKYRVPCIVLSDEAVGHQVGEVVIPPAEKIELQPRRYYTGPKGSYLPYKPDPDGVPPMTKAGDGHRFHVTGLTHDYKGYPVMKAECQQQLVPRLCRKILDNEETLSITDENGIEGADIVVVSYGSTSLKAKEAIFKARGDGLRVGHLRLVTIWPLAEKRLRAIAPQVKAFVVPELNYGQIVFEVERCAAGQAAVHAVPHGGGETHSVERIYQKIKEAAQ